MISFYKWKKNAILIIQGTIPLLIFLMVFFPTIKYQTIENIKIMYIDPVWVLISVAAAALVAVIIAMMGNKMLRHAFTEMLEGKGLVALILDSTGLIGSFNVKVNAPKMKGVFLNRNIPPIEDTYDIDMMQRLIVPKTAGMTKAYSFTRDENNNVVLGKTVEVIVLPEGDEKYEKLFSFENRPVFIFNKVLNKFLSRDALANFEKDIEIKHSALNVLRKVQETDINFRNFGRYLGDQLKPGKTGFFANPIIKYIIIAAIIGLVIFMVMLFLPGILNASSNLGVP